MKRCQALEVGVGISAEVEELLEQLEKVERRNPQGFGRNVEERLCLQRKAWKRLAKAKVTDDNRDQPYTLVVSEGYALAASA